MTFPILKTPASAMTPSSNETDRAKKGYAMVGIVLAPIVLLALVNGIMAFVRVFTHTLGAIFLTLEIAIIGLAVAAVGYWLLQRDRSAGYARMQATLEQFLLQENSSLSLVDFAAKVQLPISIARDFLDTATIERDGNCQMNDRGELIYHFTSKEPETQSELKTVTTVDVEAISTDEIDAAAAALFTPNGEEKSQGVEVEDEDENPQGDREWLPTKNEGEPSAKTVDREDIQTEEDRPTAIVEKPLIQAELARRLSLSSSTLSYRKLKPNFSQWVREKDPDGIAWRYSAQSKQFYPEQTDLSSDR